MKRKIFSLMVAMILVLTAIPAVADEEVVHWQNLGLDAMDGWTVAAGSTGSATIDTEVKAEGTGALKIVNEEGQTTTVTQAITLPSFRGSNFSVRVKLKVVSALGNGARLEVRKADGTLSRWGSDEEARTGYIKTTDEKFIILDVAPFKFGPSILTLILDGEGEVYFDDVQVKEIFGFGNSDFEGYRSYPFTNGLLGGGWSTKNGQTITNAEIRKDEVQGNYIYLPSVTDYLISPYMLRLTPGKMYRISWKYKATYVYYFQIGLFANGAYSPSLSGGTGFDFGRKSPAGEWGTGEYFFTMPEGYWGLKVTFRGRGDSLSIDDFVLEEVPETNISFAESEEGATNITTAVASSANEKAFILICRYGKQGTARVLKDVKVVAPTLTASEARGTIPVVYLGTQTESVTTEAGDTIEVMRWNSASGLSPMMDKIVR